jgi:hypothetical protein
MIVLSVSTGATTSSVGAGVGVFPAEHAATNRLASISVINNLWFMSLLPPKIFLFQSYGFQGKLPLPAGEFLTSQVDSMPKQKESNCP